MNFTVTRKPFAVCSIMASGWLAPLAQFDTYADADANLEKFWAKYPNAWIEIGQYDSDAKDYTVDF